MSLIQRSDWLVYLICVDRWSWVKLVRRLENIESGGETEIEGRTNQRKLWPWLQVVDKGADIFLHPPKTKGKLDTDHSVVIWCWDMDDFLNLLWIVSNLAHLVKWLPLWKTDSSKRVGFLDCSKDSNPQGQRSFRLQTATEYLLLIE